MSTKGCYFTFNLLYGLASIFAIMAGVAFYQYEVLMQAVLVAVVLLPFGVLVSALEPHHETGRVRRKARVIFITASVVSLACLFICAIFPIQTLASDCSGETHLKHSTLDVSLRYAAVDEASGEAEEHFIMMQYNLTDRRVVHSELIAAEDEQQPTGQRATWMERAVARERLGTEQVCTQQMRVPRFRLLAEEAEQALRQRSHKAQHKPALHISPHRADDHGYADLRHQIDRLRLRLICRYEYGPAILYIVFIFVVAVLEIFTALWYTFQVQDKEHVAK